MFESDCQSMPSMGRLFNSLISSSLNNLPMCNDSAEPRVYSPTYPMNKNYSPQSSAVDLYAEDDGLLKSRAVHVGTSPDPRRPPLNPIKPKASYRTRRKSGLSIGVPSHPSDPHQAPAAEHEDAPPLLSCARHVEMRRKSLSERHFFRPVSEDEESAMGLKQHSSA